MLSAGVMLNTFKWTIKIYFDPGTPKGSEVVVKIPENKTKSRPRQKWSEIKSRPAQSDTDITTMFTPVLDKIIQKHCRSEFYVWGILLLLYFYYFTILQIQTWRSWNPLNHLFSTPLWQVVPNVCAGKRFFGVTLFFKKKETMILVFEYSDIPASVVLTWSWRKLQRKGRVKVWLISRRGRSWILQHSLTVTKEYDNNKNRINCCLRNISIKCIKSVKSCHQLKVGQLR